jgi:hypothetical protein
MRLYFHLVTTLQNGPSRYVPLIFCPHPFYLRTCLINELLYSRLLLQAYYYEVPKIN